MLGYLFPLTAAPVTLPPYIEARLILTAATVGAITVGAATIPAGSSGVVKISMGSTATSTAATLANPADAAVASLALRTWQTLTPPAPRVFREQGITVSLGPLSAAPQPPAGSAVFLIDQPQGTLSAGSITSGLVAITGTLAAPLTLRAPGGWTQTVPGGSSGLVPLTGTPTGPNVTWNFASATDCHAVDVVVTLVS